MEKQLQKRQQTPVERLKKTLSSKSVQEQFRNALSDNAQLFTASLIDLYSGDNYLQKCDPNAVVIEALKAATLKLPINKNLGFAYVVPYKNAPQFQIGYRGLMQLAQRSGVYRHINAGPVYIGEFRGENRLTGAIDITGERTGDEVVGYFAYIETVNGFSKSIYMSRSAMEAHAKKYSKAYSRAGSPWQTEFDAMATKTMLRQILSKYGQLTVEMASAMSAESEDDSGVDDPGDDNGDVIDIETGEVCNSADDASLAADAELVDDPPHAEAPEWA